MSDLFCGLLKRKQKDTPRKLHSRSGGGEQEKEKSAQYLTSTEELYYTSRSGESGFRDRNGDRSRSASASSPYLPPTQVNRGLSGEASDVETVKASSSKMSPTTKRSRLTDAHGSTRPDEWGGNHVIQTSGLPYVSNTNWITGLIPRDSRKREVKLIGKTNKRKLSEQKILPALEARDMPSHRQGKEEHKGKQSPNLQGENSGLQERMSQLLSCNEERDEKVQNLEDCVEKMKAENVVLKKEIKKLSFVEKEGYELSKELQSKIIKLNQENNETVKDLTKTVEDLHSDNKKFHLQLEYLQRDNDILKGENDKEKKTVRKLVAEKTKLENTIKELKNRYALSPGEIVKIRKSSIPVLENDSPHQEHEFQKLIKAKNTEIKRLQEELEEESLKVQNLLHEREKFNLELVNPRREFKSAADKSRELQLCLDNSHQLLMEAGIPEAGGDLKTCVGHLIALYETCRRDGERIQRENENLTLQSEQCREQESVLREKVQEGRRALHEKKRIADELQKIAESQSSQLLMVDRENDQLKRSLKDLQLELQVRDENLARTVGDKQRQIELGERNIEDLKRKHAKALVLEDKLRQSVNELQREYQRLEQEYKEFREISCLQIQERDDKLKQSSIRISKLVAENVGRNNPFLEDLGSQNRSMKIAERFRGDLYGDIWCDTLELLVDDNVPEEEALKAICDTLLAAYQFCRDHLFRVVLGASSSLMDLTDTVLDPSLTGAQESRGDLGHLQSAMKDFLRANAMSVAPDKLLMLYTGRSRADNSPPHKALVDFIRQALPICWCMVTQDPPMSLLHTLDQMGGYDPSSFKPYRSSGSRAKFLVWPALLLTDTGPLMEKGVVYT